jgi:hypothetical protein
MRIRKAPLRTKVLLSCCAILIVAALIALGAMLSGTRVAAPAPAPAQDHQGLRFIHPLYGYALSLPLSWEGRYGVREEKNATVFFYAPHGPQAELMRIAYGRAGASMQGRKLGEYFGTAYALEGAAASCGASEECLRMRDDAEKIGSSFARTVDPENFYTKEFLAKNLSLKRDKDGIVFITYKYLAPDAEDGGVTTKYYWMMTQEYSFKDGAMRPGMGTSGPVVVRYRKLDHYDYRVIDARTLRDGSYYMQDARQLLPEAALAHPVFRNDVPARNEFTAALEKRLGEWERDYFGPSFDKNAAAALY